MSAADGTVAAVLPLYNEGSAVADLVRRMPPQVAHAIVVDDGSADDGPALAAHRTARFLMIKGYTLLFRVLIRRTGTDVTNGFRAYRLALLDDAQIDTGQEWLDHYELEYYIHYKAMTLGYRTSEEPVSKTYPTVRRSYSKIRPFRDRWSIIRPIVLPRLGLRRWS